MAPACKASRTCDPLKSVTGARQRDTEDSSATGSAGAKMPSAEQIADVEKAQRDFELSVNADTVNAEAFRMFVGEYVELFKEGKVGYEKTLRMIDGLKRDYEEPPE